MPVVNDRDSKEATLRAALSNAWSEWTAVSDPTNLNLKDLEALLRKYAYQPLWELYYTAQYAVSQELNQRISEQAIAAAFVLYYMTWANDVMQRWMSRVSTWVLEARMAAHSRQREPVAGQGTSTGTSTPKPAMSPSTTSQGGRSGPTPTRAEPKASTDQGATTPKPAMSPSTATQGGAPISTPTRSESTVSPPAIIEVSGASEPTAKPKSIADDVADSWKKEKNTVVDPDTIDMYSRDAVTDTNSAGELAVVDAASRSGKRIEAIWVLDPNSNWCERCYALDGTTRDVWSKVAPNGPKLHPKCACSLRYIEVDAAGKPVDYTAWRDRPF